MNTPIYILPYNAFGNSKHDNELVDFLNSLHESARTRRQIQKQVCALMHKVNQTILFIIDKNLKISYKLVSHDNDELINKVCSFLYRELCEEISRKKWRHSIKCRVITCMNEKFRQYRIVW